MPSSISSTPHPLDSLLDIWDRVSSGQRAAIARDFHIRTGGMMSERAHPIPRVVPLLAMETPSGEVGLLTGPGNSLPVLSLGMEISASGLATQFYEDVRAQFQSIQRRDPEAKANPNKPVRGIPSSMEFSCFGEPAFDKTGLYLFQVSATMLTLEQCGNLDLSPFSATPLSDVLFLECFSDRLAAWKSIAPLRYLSR